MKRLILVLVGLIFSYAVAAQEKGLSIAKQYCAPCHGINGATPNQQIPFIAGLNAEYIHNVLIVALNDPKRVVEKNMFSRIKQLSPEQIKQAADYFATLNTPWRGAGVGITQRRFSPSPADIAAGEQLAARCNSCHGENGNSQLHRDAPSLAAMPPQYFVMSLKSYFTSARQHKIMKMFGLGNALKARDIEQLAAYYAVQTPQKIASVNKGRSNQVKNCEMCHGPDGNSLIASLPNLTGQPAEYLAISMRAYRDGKRRHRAMKTALRNLTDRDIEDIAAYYANLTPVVATGWRKTGNDSAQLLAEGKKLAQMCDVCHGKDGNSVTASMPKLTGLSAQYLSYATAAYRKGGWQHELMQALTSLLSDEEIEKISLYYAAQQPSQPTQAAAIDMDKGKKIRAACAVCHNETAQNQDNRIPNINGQERQYLKQAMQAYATGKRPHQDMQQIAQTLLAQEPANLDNVLGYFAAQPAPAPKPPRSYSSLLVQCQHCHGYKGEHSTDTLPKLAGQVEAYLFKKLARYQQGPPNSIEHSLNLTHLEISALAAHFSKQ